MKAIIYAGIGLFSAASIYGLTDYYHSEEKGTLKNLYKEAPVSKQTKAAELPAQRDIDLKDYSRAQIAEPVEINKTATVTAGGKVKAKNSETVFKKKAVKRKAPKIKFSNFSRSALVVEEKLPVAVTDSSTEKY